MKEVLKTPTKGPEKQLAQILSDSPKHSLIDSPESEPSENKEALESPKKKWDPGTLYAAAFMCKRQEHAHHKQMWNIMNHEDQRKAHKFVAQNCDALALSILALSGDSISNCARALSDMKDMIENPQKRKV